MKKYYEENKNNYVDDEVRASHILISTVDQKLINLFQKKSRKKLRKKLMIFMKKLKQEEILLSLLKKIQMIKVLQLKVEI
ncbi:hypothetical protein QJS64_03955 [Paraclostridium bifermentans]|uniref:Uncharacterized protein n=1 Tax=Paraclostridium bifermentans TaxID=1490 RepID=A0ABY8R6R9_PARBF|nr:hypothetical protein QJS64_03955 [Paraclostridium bifermentans]